MTKCSGFFVYVRIAVKSIGLYEAQKKAPPVEPVRLFDYFGAGHVPKCLTGLGIETTRNAPQVIGGIIVARPQRPAGRTGDDFSISCKQA
jgi:hypothetical protein